MSDSMHADQLEYLKKIEGQIRGLQKMIEDGRYCVDILTQIKSVSGAIRRVEANIFHKHLENCVTGALESGSRTEKEKKIAEVLELIERYHKG
ncbi:MAG: metal-sensitive transcriptional regulator [Candidatus Omnitrophica bacterium]|nr:metal-sensitive transcriptional regulator [Candidatus Omnitrophota bacterium]